MSWTLIAPFETEGPTGGLTMVTRTFRQAAANGHLIRVDKVLTITYLGSTYYGLPISSMVFFPADVQPATIAWGPADEETEATGTIQTLKTRFYQGLLFDEFENQLDGCIYRHEFYSQPSGMPPVTPSLSLVFVP